MFGSSRKGEEQAPVQSKGATLIAANTRVTGDIQFSDQLLINGEVSGNVYAESGSDATLTVSAKGAVNGEIRVPNVLINGRVQGDVYASKHVELASEARVEGNVYYQLIEMVKGARVDGSLVYQAASKEAKAGERKAHDAEVATAAAGTGTGSTPAAGTGSTPVTGAASGPAGGARSEGHGPRSSDEAVGKALP